MKKIFTLSMALTGASVIMAASPEVSLDAVGNASENVLKSEYSAPAVLKKADRVSVEESALFKSASALNSASANNAPEASAVNLYYAGPNGGFYGYTYLDNAQGRTTYFNDGALAPAYVDNTFLNRSTYVEDGKYMLVADGDYNFAWSTYAFDGDVTAFNLTYESFPNDYAGYAWFAPTLKLGDKSYRKPAMWNNEELNLLYQVGGTLYNEETMENRKTNNPTYTNFRYIAHPYCQTDPQFHGSYATNIFAYGPTIISGQTASNYAISAWDDVQELSGVTDVTDIKAFYQDIACPAPMVISFGYMNIQANYKAGAKLKFEFYTLENGEPKDLFNSYEYELPGSFTTTGSLTRLQVKIPFTSKDAAGFDVDYTIVDKDFRVVVTNLDDPNINMFRWLVVGMDRFGNGLEPGKPGASSVAVYHRGNIGAYCVGKKDGVDGTYAVQNYYYNYGEDEDENGETLGTWTVQDPISFDLGFDMEYPYLQVAGAALNGSNKITGVELAKEYTANVKNASQRAIYQVMCPGSVDDVLVETVDGEDVPEWLYYEVNNTMIKPGTGYEEATPNYFALVFALEDGANPGGCEVKVSYKGQYNIFKINPDLSGIEGVVDNGVENVASEYYDLQGRKLSVEPLNGLFIRKDIKADGSVKAVKVVK